MLNFLTRIHSKRLGPRPRHKQHTEPPARYLPPATTKSSDKYGTSRPNVFCNTPAPAVAYLCYGQPGAISNLRVPTIFFGAILVDHPRHNLLFASRLVQQPPASTERPPGNRDQGTGHSQLFSRFVDSFCWHDSFLQHSVPSMVHGPGMLVCRGTQTIYLGRRAASSEQCTLGTVAARELVPAKMAGDLEGHGRMS